MRMRSHLLTIAALLLTGLSACSGPDDTKRSPPPSPKDTVFGDMISAKEKAEREAKQAAEQRKQQLEDAEKKSAE